MKELLWYFFTSLAIAIFQGIYNFLLFHLIYLIDSGSVNETLVKIMVWLSSGFVALLAVGICNGISGHGYKVRLTLPGEK